MKRGYARGGPPIYYKDIGPYQRLEMEPVKFMEFVREVMVEHGISQYALAAQMGTQQPHVWRWLHGQRRPQLETRMRIDYALMKIVEDRLASFT